MRYSKKTQKWYNGSGGGYVEIDSCVNCGNSFLSREGESLFCSPSCKNKGKFNPMYGKTHTSDVRSLLRKNIKKSINTITSRYGVNNPSYLDMVKIKKGQFIVNFNNCSKIVGLSGFVLVSLVGNNKNAIMTLKCNNGHVFKVKWCNWKRGTRCVECYYDEQFKNSNCNYQDFKLYKKIVYYLSNKNYKNYINIINPSRINRSKHNHLDHKFSVVEGFKNGIIPMVISDPINLEIISCTDNCSKQHKCSITKEELLNEYSRKIRGNPVSM